MSSPSFNVFQQIFALSYSANLVSTSIGPAYELQEKLGRILRDGYLENNVGPGWSVVWGPAAWQHNPDPSKPVSPDNVWYVAKHESLAIDGETPTPVYVVCIAGTGGTGQGFDGLVEDVSVGRVVDCNEWIPDNFTGDVISGPKVASNPEFTSSTPYVSYGTAIGTFVIAAMPPATPDGQNSTYPTICEFLKNEDVAPGTRLIFTGHSLGGALSPTLAYVLHKAKLLSRFEKVLTYPIAGASPGDANFVAEFSQRFPSIPPGEGQPVYMSWNHNLTNHLDIVPHAWCTLDNYPQNLNVLPGLFGNDATHGAGVYWYLVGLKSNLVTASKKAWPGEPKEKQNVYIPLPSSPFSSEQRPYPKTVDELMAMAMYTHVRAYVDCIYGKDFKFPPVPYTEAAVEEYAPMGLGHVLAYAEGVPADSQEVSE